MRDLWKLPVVRAVSAHFIIFSMRTIFQHDAARSLLSLSYQMSEQLTDTKRALLLLRHRIFDIFSFYFSFFFFMLLPRLLTNPMYVMVAVYICSRRIYLIGYLVYSYLRYVGTYYQVFLLDCYCNNVFTVFQGFSVFPPTPTN